MYCRTHTWIAALFILGHALCASEITQLGRSGTNLTFNLMSDRYAEYLIQRSTNLTHWETLRRSFGPSTNRAFQISSLSDPAQPKAFYRAMQTNEPYAGYAIVAKGAIVLGSNTVIDSFDSSNPLHSANGRYDLLKRKDTAFVATLSSSTNPAIQRGRIYGSAATGAGGTTTGTIGDGIWQATQTGIQPGHLQDNFNMAIPNAALPTNFNPGTPLLILPSSINVDGDYKLSGGFSGQVTITKKVRLWITGDVRLIGPDFIKVAAGGSLELYLSWVTAEFGGGGVINNNADASTFKIFGLPTCVDMRFRSNAAITAQIYAPVADVDLGGTPDFMGGITAKSVEASGNSGIHFDEALSR
jgi:hypothetical protein